MSGHTPGPWLNGRQMSNSANAIIGDGDSVVAILPGAWNHCTHIEADARLIAAAPELLEALESLSAWVNRAIVTEYTARKPMPENCRKALEASVAAIAKATQP